MKQKLILIAVGVLLLVSGLGIGYVVRGDNVPSEDSAEVGFARDMSVHHLQAVQMLKRRL